MYLNSTNVKVFPFGGSRVFDPYSNVLNEHNLTSLVQGVLGCDSYVVNYDNTSKIIEFILKGYYFKANISSVLEKGWEKVFAEISVTTSQNDYSSLIGSDIALYSAGDGSSVDAPFVLLGGGCLKLTSQEQYFEYTLAQSESSVQIVVPYEEDIIDHITIRPFNNTKITENDDKAIVSLQPHEPSNKVTFSLQINDSGIASNNNLSVKFIANELKSEFTGVSFVEDVEESSSTSTLHILTKDGPEVYSVPCQNIINCGTSTDVI